MTKSMLSAVALGMLSIGLTTGAAGQNGAGNGGANLASNGASSATQPIGAQVTARSTAVIAAPMAGQRAKADRVPRATHLQNSGLLAHVYQHCIPCGGCVAVHLQGHNARARQLAQQRQVELGRAVTLHLLREGGRAGVGAASVQLKNG